MHKDVADAFEQIDAMMFSGDPQPEDIKVLHEYMGRWGREAPEPRKIEVDIGETIRALEANPELGRKIMELCAPLMETPEREPPFPMLNGPSISWKTAEKIYEIYSDLYGTQQSLKRLSERGGFGWSEVELMCRKYDSKHGTRALNDLLGL